MPNLEKQYYYTMDAIKFICAIFVVLIHTSAPILGSGKADYSNYFLYRPLLDIAVPFFFAATGFFLSIKVRQYLELDVKIKYLLNYFKKILFIYLGFTVFYMLFHIASIVLDRIVLKTAFKAQLASLLKSWSTTSLVNGTIGSFHLWYLTALLIAILLLLICIRFSIKPQNIFILSILLNLVTITGIIDFNGVFLYGGFSKGFFFLSMGYFLGFKKEIKMKQPLWGLFISIVIYTLLFRYSGVAMVFLFLAAYYLIVFSIQNKGKPTLLSNLGSKGINIYILHIFVLECVNKVFLFAGFTNYHSLTMYYIITPIICIIVPIFIYNPINNFFIKPLTKAFNY